MRFLALALLASGTLLTAGTDAGAQTGCGEYRAICESACTPERVAHSYAGSHRRCTASCEPRWQHCLKTGTWVDLERRVGGGSHSAPPF